MNPKLLIPLCFLFAACGSARPASELNDLAFDASSDNVAFLFTGTDSRDSYQETFQRDATLFRDTLTSPSIQFSATEPYTLPKDELLQQLAIAASTVTENGTMLLYYSGHGLGEAADGEEKRGALSLSSNERLHFSEISEAIQRARLGKPLKRLLVFIDACYSGHWVNGDQSVIDTSANLDANSLFEQAFVMSSSSLYQPSETSPGLTSHFTYYLDRTLKELNADSTFRSLAAKTIRKTQRGTQSWQTPQFRALPTSLLDNETVLSQ